MNLSSQTSVAGFRTPRPVVVLKVAHYLSLGIARSLGRLGVPAYCVENDLSAPGTRSRFWSGRFQWDVDNAPWEATVSFLLDVAKRIGRNPVLIHTADESAEMIAQYADVLSDRFVFHKLDPVLVRTLTSKKAMFHLANQHGVPTAGTMFPGSREDVLRYANNGVVLPIMVKGIDGVLLEKRVGYKMRIAQTREEIIALYDQMEDPSHPNLMLQEYIPGGDDGSWMLEGYFNDKSDCLFSMTGKKIRQAPIHTGYTSLGICLKNTEMQENTARFMKEIGYRGIADIDYRYDARDGRYKILDINPRVGATFRLFVADGGMDVVRAAYLDLNRQPITASTPIEGRKWLAEDRDLMSSFRYFRQGSLSLRQWFQSLRGVKETAWYAGDDTLPFLVMVWHHLKSGRRRLKSIFRSRGNR